MALKFQNVFRLALKLSLHATLIVELIINQPVFYDVQQMQYNIWLTFLRFM